LVFMEEGNNDKITMGEKQLINFGKYRLMFDVISSNVLQLQKVCVVTSSYIKNLQLLIPCLSHTYYHPPVHKPCLAKQVGYSYRTQEMIRNFIVKDFRAKLDEDTLYAQSLQREPRNAARSEIK